MTVEHPIDFEAIENAIHDWIWAATGLQTVWQNQNAPTPPSPFMTLAYLTGPIPMGSVAETRESTDANRDAGEEVELESAMACQFTLSCQAFVKGSDGSNPTANAMAYCLKALMALELPSYIDLLNEVNVSVASITGPRNLSLLVGSEMESRAGFDITFNSILSLSEFTGYIERVHAVSTELGIDRIFGVGQEI